MNKVNYKLAITALVAGLVAVNGVLHLVDDSVVSQVLGLLAALGLYLLPSPLASGQCQPADAGRSPGWPRVLPLLLAGLALFDSATPAQAQLLPWRRQIEQRLRALEQKPSPAPAPTPTPAPAPAPQIIYLPYQQLPIGGQPKQDLPIQGAPKQDLPIQGAPKQQLPIPGTPQQQLPIPGNPQQQLPVPGPVPQQLPQDNGLGGAPQPYTIIRALYRR
jgi:hypothetical protein